ncbi:hypothetical protein AOLI_G00194030 [Acnodon oligacanthus]
MAEYNGLLDVYGLIRKQLWSLLDCKGACQRGVQVKGALCADVVYGVLLEAEDFGCHEETLVEHNAIYTVLEGNEDEERFWTLKCVMEIPFSGLELVFIFIAFTVFCVFSIAAVYTYTQTNNQDEKMHSDRKTTHPKSSFKRKTKNAVKTVNPDLP